MELKPLFLREKEILSTPEWIEFLNAFEETSSKALNEILNVVEEEENPYFDSLNLKGIWTKELFDVSSIQAIATCASMLSVKGWGIMRTAPQTYEIRLREIFSFIAGYVYIPITSFVPSNQKYIAFPFYNTRDKIIVTEDSQEKEYYVGRVWKNYCRLYTDESLTEVASDLPLNQVITNVVLERAIHNYLPGTPASEITTDPNGNGEELLEWIKRSAPLVR